MGWAILLTRRGAEEEAEDQIIRAGFRVYLPRLKKRLRGVRFGEDGRRIRTHGEGGIVFLLLLPKILFVEIPSGEDNPDLAAILAVGSILRYSLPDGMPGAPRLIDDEIIDRFRALVDAAEWDKINRPNGPADRSKLVVGNSVRVVDGVLSGLIGVLVELGDQGAADLLLDSGWHVEISPEIPLQLVDP